MMIALKDILDLPRFSDLKLATNYSTLDSKMVESAEVGETPDIEYFIPRNCIVITTAMIFKDNQEKLIPYIDSLIRAGASGLAIKINRFLNDLDDSVIHYANHVSFPIIIIPDNYTLGALLHQVMNLIKSTEREEISYALDIQKSFSNLLINDSNNQDLVNELSRISDLPILLLDPFKQILVFSEDFDDQKILANLYMTQLNNLMSENNREEGLFMLKDKNGESLPVSLIKVNVLKYFPHYLVIFEPEKLSYPISAFALDQAALVFTFNLYKNLKLSESKFARETYFFNHLINQRTNHTLTAEQWLGLSAEFGYLETSYYQIAHVTLASLISNPDLNQINKEKLLLTYIWLRKHLNEFLPQSLVFWKAESSDIFILLQNEAIDLENNLKELKISLDQMLDDQIIFSFGQPVTKHKYIYESLTEAEFALDERKITQNKDTFAFYKNHGISQLFSSVDFNEISYFCQSILKDLMDSKDEGIKDLRETLLVYLNNQCEITKTANDLYIHRNTVKYRIEKCENILGIEVSSPENSLNLRLALTLFKKHFS